MSARTMIVSLAAPYLIELVADIIEDAVTDGGVTEFRDKIVNHITAYVEKTETSFDDKVFAVITKKILTEENFLLWGRKLISLARQYVLHSKTKWDDLCLPLIDILEDILAPPASA